MISGQCWLVVEGIPEPVLLNAGDCFLLPLGLPFRLATDLSLEPVHFTIAWARLGMSSEAPGATEGACYIAGGHFALTGGHPEMLLQSLPPIVHIRREPDKVAMRWSLDKDARGASQSAARRIDDCAAAHLHDAHSGAAPASDSRG